MLVVRDDVGGINSESTVNEFIVIMIRFSNETWSKLLLSDIIWRSQMLLQSFFNLLLVPFPFVPKAIHFFIYLAGVVLADKIAQLLHLFFGFEVRQQTKKIHLCLI